MSENQEIKKGGVAHEFWEIIRVLLVSLAIVLPIRYFIVQPFIVRGASMEPTFENKEYLVVDEVSYYFREPKRGEVIVFRYPRDPSQFFIKRIIGLPGEKVEIYSGRVKIVNPEFSDGFTLDEPYLDPPNHFTTPDTKITLGSSQYFVLGDNRDFSSDSRIWGTLERKFITGRVFFRAWPVTRLGFLTD